TRLTLVTPRGTPGLKRVQGKDRYGRMTELAEPDGFGYGLRQLAVTQAAQAKPVDVIVDQETGVALTATGYFHETFSLEKLLTQGPIVDGIAIPESLLAASFDVQEAASPLLVGGVGSLPSGERGAADLKRHATYQKLSSKALLNEITIDCPALTEEERAELERLSGPQLPVAVDSVRLSTAREWEEGVWRKRLYVANGVGGVSRLNLDEQNGLQVLGEALTNQGVILDLAQQGYALYGSSGTADGDKRPEECASALYPGRGDGVYAANFSDPSDPVEMGSLAHLQGGAALTYDQGWLYSGTRAAGALWGPCPFSVDITGARLGDGSSDRILALDLFDGYLTQTYEINGHVHDLVRYGDYLVAALGGQGVEIFHSTRPEQRVRVALDTLLQSRPGRALRL